MRWYSMSDSVWAGATVIDAVASAVAYDLHLEFLPALDALLDEDFADGGELDALRHYLRELCFVVGDTAARSAEGVRRPKHDGKADGAHDGQRIIDRVGITGTSRLYAQLGHALVEELAVLATLDGWKGATDHLDAEAVEHARFGQLDSHIEGGLATERRQ